MQVTVSLTATGFDVAGDIERIRALTGTLPDDLANVAADTAVHTVLAEAESIRGSLSMSNNELSRTLDAIPIVRPGSPHAEAEIQAVPRGAWHLVNYGTTGSYEIRPKRGPGGRRGILGTKRALRTPYGPKGKVIHGPHPRTDVWERAMEAAEPTVIDVVETAFTVAVEPDRAAAI